MCMVSTPKINTTAPPVQYMHNTYLDGVNDGEGESIGRNSLRIDLANQDENNGLSTPSGSSVSTGSGLNAPTTTLGASGPSMSTPGLIIPTVGGSAAGALPANVTIAAAAAK